MTPINFKVGDDDYQLIPHTGFTALNLDRKVLGLVGKMAVGLVDNDEVSAYAMLSGAFAEMSDSDYRWLVETTLNRVTVTTQGKKNFSLGDMDVIAEHFSGKMDEMYSVMMKVWQLEKLSPFAKAPKLTDGA